MKIYELSRVVTKKLPSRNYRESSKRLNPESSLGRYIGGNSLQIVARLCRAHKFTQEAFSQQSWVFFNEGNNATDEIKKSMMR